MARQSDYITEARQHARKLWDAVYDLQALQAEWNSRDYGNTLADGTGENDGYTAGEVGAVVFATTDAIVTLFGTGHGTNVASLL